MLNGWNEGLDPSDTSQKVCRVPGLPWNLAFKVMYSDHADINITARNRPDFPGVSVVFCISQFCFYFVSSDQPAGGGGKKGRCWSVRSAERNTMLIIAKEGGGFPWHRGVPLTTELTSVSAAHRWISNVIPLLILRVEHVDEVFLA